MAQSTAFLPLSRHHREELTIHSSIDPDVIAERGYRTIARPDRNSPSDNTRTQLAKMGFPMWAIREDYYFPGLLIPMYRPDGTPVPGQFKPIHHVPNRDGKRMKYAAARGMTVLDVHPRWSRDRGQDDPAILPAIRDASLPLYITEGTKKADALTSRGCVTIGLLGVYNWRSTHGLLADWENVALKGREVTIVFDSDVVDKGLVRNAMERLGRWLRSKGAKVWYVTPPPGDIKGVDDWFASGATLDDLVARRAGAPPIGRSEMDIFTESALAERVCQEIMDGSYLHVTNMGWYRWTGERWASIGDGAVKEAIREFLRDQYAEAHDAEGRALRAGRTDEAARIAAEIDQWRKTQTVAKVNAIYTFCQHMDPVTAEIGTFDTHHDLLNTPTGVVDLRTGAIGPHDPDLRMTKITTVGYRSDASSADLDAALKAVPADALGWLQARIGQAATGWEPEDESITVLSGGGSNGKTVIMGAVYAALGTYAAKLPNTILLRDKNTGGATPDKMRLQGTRLAYIEETPEGRYLDTQALKEIVGTGDIVGRHLFRDYVEFGTTHSVFLNTNYLPNVGETDNGTWRRLSLISFPYRYRKPSEDLENEDDRRGDPGVKARLKEDPRAQEAVLAWVVAGAIRVLGTEGGLQAIQVPESVQKATAEWRAEADPILGYIGKHMMIKPDGWVLLDDLVTEIAAYAQERGGKVTPALLGSRIKAHGGLPGHVRVQRVRTVTHGEPSRPAWAQKPFATQPTAVIGIVWP